MPGHNIYQLLRYRLHVIPQAARRHHKALEEIRRKGFADVALVASSLSMWRLEGVYRLMEKDSRFRVKVYYLPFREWDDVSIAREEASLRQHFEESGIVMRSAGDFLLEHHDIIFYPQCYRHCYSPALSAKSHEDSLLCYSPYGIMFIDERWQYNSRYQNVAWKLFLQNEYHRRTARRLAFNRGVNVVVAGEADSERFEGGFKDPWKPQDRPKKRVIWAPHHSFGSSDKLARNSFLWVESIMRSLAVRYQDSIQFCLKPHPRLFTELTRLDGWGEEKVREFCEFWGKRPNCQIENGEFIGLFRASDALIHDCNSFSAEYMYTGRPALFLTRNLERVLRDLNEVGRRAIEAHYTGGSEKDICDFLDSVVLGDSAADTKAESRRAFRENYLEPDLNGNFSSRVVGDIRKSIWGED